ncbi:MAG: hypothetical protein K2P22_11365 [Lachnospiraceae bacterium]|nr:hypothetical protein [Lachnospiraceae bacterium]
MQKTSALYGQLIRDPGHRKEVRADISGEWYGEDRIVALSTAGGIFSAPDIGGCACRQIDLALRSAGTIPKQAKIKIFVRLVKGELASEWLPKGEFFLSTRRRDKRTGQLQLHGFDAMLRANGVWLTEDYVHAHWPMEQREAVEDIAARMGVEVDPRTWDALRAPFPVDYPVDENGDLTMTDILEGIAAANVGNWLISDEGRLLLLGLGDIPPETNYLVTEYGAAITLGGVKILVG